MTFQHSILLLVVLLSSFTERARSVYEVPTKKAIPPLMDPVPTLPIVTRRAYLEIEMDGVNLGRIVFGLFGEVCPKAVENFISLCRCDQGPAPITGKDMCYKGSKIHRVIPNFMIQGGDYTHGTGAGGESIYPGNDFEDESFEVKHNRRYMLSMANSGRKNTNRSQFFINTVKTQWLQGKNEIFGMVLEGLSVIQAIEKVGTLIGKPKANIVIVNSGELPTTADDATPRLVSEKLQPDTTPSSESKSAGAKEEEM